MWTNHKNFQYTFHVWWKHFHASYIFLNICHIIFSIQTFKPFPDWDLCLNFVLYQLYPVRHSVLYFSNIVKCVLCGSYVCHKDHATFKLSCFSILIQFIFIHDKILHILSFYARNCCCVSLRFLFPDRNGAVNRVQTSGIGLFCVIHVNLMIVSVITFF